MFGESTTTDVLPWERRTEAYPIETEEGPIVETEDAFQAFVCYRDMTITHPNMRRSIRLAYMIRNGIDPAPHGGNDRALTQYQQAPGYFKDWSRRYAWVERAAAFDRFLDRQRMHARIAAINDVERELAAKSPELARTLLNMALGIAAQRVPGVQGNSPFLEPKDQLAALKYALDKSTGQAEQRVKLDQALTVEGGDGSIKHTFDDNQLSQIAGTLVELGLLDSTSQTSPNEQGD